MTLSWSTMIRRRFGIPRLAKSWMVEETRKSSSDLRNFPYIAEFKSGIMEGNPGISFWGMDMRKASTSPQKRRRKKNRNSDSGLNWWFPWTDPKMLFETYSFLENPKYRTILLSSKYFDQKLFHQSKYNDLQAVGRHPKGKIKIIFFRKREFVTSSDVKPKR